MIINKYSTTELEFALAQYFDNTVLSDMIAAEITFGIGAQQVRKLWYSYDSKKSTATINRANKTLNIKLSNTDTALWKYQIPIQIRIKRRNNAIAVSSVFYGYIQESLSTEEF